MSLVAQCLRGSGPVPRIQNRIRLKARENKVIKVPGGAVLRGCKKTRRKLKAHFQLRAEIHSQLRVIASLFVLRIFLTCLVGYPTPGFRSAPTPPAVQPPLAPDAAPLPPLPMRAPAQPASMDMDWEPDPDPDPDPDPEPEPEPAPAPPTLRPPSARLAACHPPPAAPSVSHPRSALCVWLQMEEDMAEVSMQGHGRAKQLVVFFGAAGIGTRVAPRKPPQAPRSSQDAPQPAASEPGPSTPLPAKRSKRTKAEPAAEPNKAKGKAAKVKPAPQPGRWVDRDCNAALNMQRIGESKWRPLELCYWPEQGALPAKGKEYPGLGYKRLRDTPPKAQHVEAQ
ncbi:hypothetical protein QJQ45_012208 [Haematococcus lacustris]|nr:hypothetical protein QJQ45_012208 [Haematococcus lacustris]